MENTTSNICITCHQPIKIEYYFCPNCGKKIQEAPLPTSKEEQIKLYLFSIILPLFLFIGVGKWDGIKYLKSKDEKTKQIGIIACVLMAISLFIICYLAYIAQQAAIKSINDSITTDFGI